MVSALRILPRLYPAALWLGLTLAISLVGCRYYSFTGATIPAHLNTLSIPLVEDNSISTITTLDDEMTDLLVDRFIRQTRLVLEPDELEGNAVLTVQITRYTNQPTAVSGDERATLNRVSITASARYFDQVEEEEIFDRTFQGTEEYNPLEDGFEGEQQAASAALVIIADDIFTAATSDW